MNALKQLIKDFKLKPCECSCDVCKEACRRKMCWGTPNDILNLINNGYAPFLNRVLVAFVLDGEQITIPMIQLRFEESGCVMLDSNGLCVLHNTGLKPTEGRLFFHPEDDDDRDVLTLMMMAVAMEWEKPENHEKVGLCFKKLLFHRINP